MPSVSLTDLELALDFLPGLDMNSAYVSRQNGLIHIIPADIEAGVEVPDDVETSDQYVALPDKNYFDLGNQLVYRFTEQEMPQEYDQVRDMFRQKGAYGRLKQLLQSKHLLDRWHQFEDEQKQAALREWCEQNGFQVAE